MLLRFVGRRERHARLGKRSLALQLQAKETLEGVDAGTGELPLRLVLPLEFGLHGLGHAPTVGKAELSQHGARRGGTKVFHEVFAQKSHGHCIEQQRSLSGEANHASFRVELEQFLMV